MSLTFADRQDTAQIEEGVALAPKFDDQGLIPAVVTDHDSGELLMVAYMNDEALRNTIATKQGHFYSRSRKKQWKKGESSGHVLEVQEIRVDCDQDCVWLRVRVAGGGACCHVGYRSCFYRATDLGPEAAGQLAFTESDKAFDPEAVYGKK